ncbi:hypothetical protein [uncultured Porphyromonas sp.]|uniref:hypothetical protein n=1 Tax=uncultured Porphyromonas sp. TaxID=159274 RepID=UPI00258360BB|nr:hypothetical protein [uncultured Porphyromonas sp.]
MKRNLLILVLLVWSVGLVAEEPPTRPLSPYDQAVVAYREGRYADVEHWYHSLSRRDQRRAETLRLATLSAINDYRLETARERLEQYEGLRLRGEEERAKRGEVVAHLELVERLLSNSRVVATLDTLVAPRAEIWKRLQRETSYLGEVQENTYLSPDGKSRWQVGSDADCVPLFYIYHQLGDGRWDEANPEVVRVNGLPEGCQISYPFVGSDGTTIYFSLEEEKGEVPQHTLGGKDLYVSRYNRAEGVLLVPTQLMLPFNSPMDDFCYIVDEEQDQGWMVSGREARGDSLRLWCFAPSTLARYEGENLREVARWLTPELKPRKRGNIVASPALRNREEPLFWVGDDAIYKQRLQGSQVPEGLVAEYLKVQELLKECEASLEALRLQLGRGGTATQLKEEVLSLEKESEGYRTRLFTLRNEIIRLWRGGE